jgi:hypothetical protein
MSNCRTDAEIQDLAERNASASSTRRAGSSPVGFGMESTMPAVFLAGAGRCDDGGPVPLAYVASRG